MTQIQQLEAEIHKIEKRCEEISDDLSEYNQALDELQKKYGYHELRTEQRHLENDLYSLGNKLVRAKVERLVEALIQAPAVDGLPVEISTPSKETMLRDLRDCGASYAVTVIKHESGDSYAITFGQHKIIVPQDVLDDPERLDIRQDPVASMLDALTREQKLDALARLKAELAVDVGIRIPYNSIEEDE